MRAGGIRRLCFRFVQCNSVPADELTSNMAFTGAISGLFSCGRARKPETREEVDAAAGTGGEGGTTRSDPEFATTQQPIDATTNVTDKGYNIHQHSAPPQLSAPRFSEELFPFAAVHPVPAVPEPAPAEPASPPKLERASEEPQRKTERRQSGDVASKAGKGAQIEHRILVTAVARPEKNDAAPELKVEHIETSVNDAAPVTKAPEVTPTIPIEQAQTEPEKVEEVGEDIPTPRVEVEQASPVPTAAPAPKPQTAAPIVREAEVESAIVPVEVQQASSSEDEQLPVPEPETVPEAQETMPVITVVEQLKPEEKPAVVVKAEKPLSRTAPTLLNLPQGM